MTSIEFLFKELWETSKDKFAWYSILEKAKEVHNKEIVDAYVKGYVEDIPNPIKGEYYIANGKQYYQETFGSKDINGNEIDFIPILKDYHIVDVNEMVEISDEEIERQAEQIESAMHRMFFKTGAMWYRNQLKSKLKQ